MLAAIVLVIETATTTSQVREPRDEANHQPFFEIERLKQNLLHQLERFAERLKDFDFWFVSIHTRHSERVSWI